MVSRFESGSGINLAMGQRSASPIALTKRTPIVHLLATGASRFAWRPYSSTTQQVIVEEEGNEEIWRRYLMAHESCASNSRIG
jgi:hypothetical protein